MKQSISKRFSVLMRAYVTSESHFNTESIDDAGEQGLFLSCENLSISVKVQINGWRARMISCIQELYANVVNLVDDARSIKIFTKRVYTSNTDIKKYYLSK
ncbi:hypothetical protein RF11_06602 [Thelohanellus kitauei]|uniref:Uncharacterized protein n=1 Tax=Thelohanellus kitauei TaxID=669202 RepID=A0A0C2IH97_THEKT|nr:hypothetical protein RF11_06602 [Thelohanellus kitauei]